MIWAIGYLIGTVLCVIVLAFTNFNCDDGDTVWLVAIMWPLILFGYFLLLIYALVVFVIDVCLYVINVCLYKIRGKKTNGKKGGSYDA